MLVAKARGFRVRWTPLEKCMKTKDVEEMDFSQKNRVTG